MIIGHVKWFVIESGSTEPFLLSEPATFIWAGIVLAGFSIAGLLNKALAQPSKNFLKKAEASRERLIYIFQILLGLSLVFTSFDGALLAPHYDIPSNWGFLGPIQALIGFFLIANVAVPAAAYALIALYLISALLFGPVEALDYLNLFGMGLFLLLSKSPQKLWKSHQEKAIPVLRIFTGIALLVLAFSEKIWNIDAAMALLMQYDLNFMPLLGFEQFSDRLFILSAGSMEALFGLILIAGFITRINILALTSFFLMTNIYFYATGNAAAANMELMGHLPVLGTVVLLVAYGAGTKTK
jgi:uncharacterized membrane protein YphA (DoxX/SURF4 family)